MTICKGKSKRPPSPTSLAPLTSKKGNTKASKVVSDDQYDKFLKFQVLKKKEANLNHQKGLRKNVDIMLDEEESNTEHEVTMNNKRKKDVKAKPVDTDEDVEDDTNPNDILPHLDPMKKKMPIISEDSDNEGQPEPNELLKTNVARERPMVKKRGNGLIEVKDKLQDDTAVRRHRRGPIKNVFPGSSVDVQDAFAWNCIKEAGKESGSPMKLMFDHISEDDILKGRALAYIWSGASQLRRELAKKARENAKMFNKNLPFHTHLIKQLLMGQFFQHAWAEGLLYKEEFKKLPDNLIALLAASSAHTKYYISKLTEYSLKMPSYMKKLRDDLWTNIGKACRFQLRDEGGFSDESDVDFDIMEEYARPTTGVTNIDDVVIN
ncbi:hypothetical protein BDR06DRAFT_971913 [Suillus hirtellus]|nr:hypothetical protein BDR06DRAFT_971913 [Suillus hirtellus]